MADTEEEVFEFPEEPEQEGAAAWMATFADMMTLLLTFFVLLLSFATMDITTFRAAMGAVRESMGIRFQKHDEPGFTKSHIEMNTKESTENLEILKEAEEEITAVREVLEKLDKADTLEATLATRGMIVRVKGDLVYESGEAVLLPESDDTLNAILTLSRVFAYPIRIEGHTDDRPIGNAHFKSNWELSTGRAAAAMRWLIEHGVDGKRLSIAGYADRRPLVPNDSPENRLKNRRVEFVFIRPVGAPPIDLTKSAMPDQDKAAMPIPDMMRLDGANEAGNKRRVTTPATGSPSSTEDGEEEPAVIPPRPPGAPSFLPDIRSTIISPRERVDALLPDGTVRPPTEAPEQPATE